MLNRTINIKGELFSLDRPVVMGILNVTPDSFFAGSRKRTEAEIAARIEEILAQGGDWIDIGGYSSRPDATPVTADEEMRRLELGLEILSRDAVIIPQFLYRSIPSGRTWPVAA